MLEIENYSFKFQINFLKPKFFPPNNPKHQKCIQKINKTQQNYNSKPKCKKVYLNIFYVILRLKLPIKI